MITIIITIQIVIIILLLLLSALFSGTETAYTSIDDVTLLRLIREGKLKETDKKFWQKSHSLIPSLLVGNNLVNIAATSLVTVLSIEMGRRSEFFSESVMIMMVTTVYTLSLLIFGEIFPKTIMRINAEKFIPSLIKFAKLSYYIFTPVTILLNFITSFIMDILVPKKLRPEDRRALVSSMEDISSIINLGHKEGIIKGNTLDLLNGVIDFRHKTVESIMIPRVDMYCLEAETPIREILALSIETGHSRFPVYDETLDHIIGIFRTKVIFKDYLKGELQSKKAIDYIMLPYFVPETKSISMLFGEMQKQKLQMAIVIDEYGGTAGLVSMEDIVEEIMGEIEDESDKAQSYIKYRGRRAMVNGLAPLSVVNSELKLDLSHDEYQTIAGYVLELLGHIPGINENFMLSGYKCRINKMEDRRIIELEFSKSKKFPKEASKI